MWKCDRCETNNDGEKCIVCGNVCPDLQNYSKKVLKLDNTYDKPENYANPAAKKVVSESFGKVTAPPKRKYDICSIVSFVMGVFSFAIAVYEFIIRF